MVTILERPRFKYSEIDGDLLERVRSYNPRTHIGALVKASFAYLPEDMALELLDTLAGTVQVETELKIVVMRSHCLGNLHCEHIYSQIKGFIRCPKCSEVWTAEDLGVVSRHVVTNNGVKNIVDVWNSAGSALNLWKFVGLGTGTTAEAAADSVLVTELTTEYATDSVRATGVISQPSNNVARVVDTNTLDSGTPAVTEAGLFTLAAATTGVLWDRFKFSAINLVGANGDGLQTTINSTFTAGG